MKGTSHKILNLVLAFVLVLSTVAALAAPAFGAAASVPPTAVTAVTFAPGPATAGVIAGYTIGFTTSATGALAAGVDTITVTFPAGTVLPASIDKANASVAGVVCLVSPTVNGQVVTLVTPAAVALSTATTVFINQAAGIKNPVLGTATAKGKVYTSQDLAEVTSANYTISRLVTFAPPKGPIGSAVTVSGVGFAANSSIDLTGGATGAGTTDATGTFSFAGVVSAAGGVITATDGAGNATASVALFVLTPSIAAAPTTALVGTPVTVTLKGLTAAQTYGISFAGAPVNITAVTAGGVRRTTGFVQAVDTTATTATVTIIVPVAASGGAKVLGVRLTDAAGGLGDFVAFAMADAATTTFTVTPCAITLSPATGPAGTAITVTGAGYSAFAPALGSTIVSSGGVVLFPAPTFATAGDGSWVNTITIPAGTAAGTYTITATDSNGKIATANFVIPALAAVTASLSPAVGPIGTVVTVTGANYQALTTISATFRTPTAAVTSVVGTSTTDSVGNASVTFTVPTSEAGFATVALIDSVGNTKAVTFTVTQGAAVITVQNALTSVSSNVPIVWTFVGATQSWSLYDTSAPAVSDLKNMTNNQGYWMQATADCTLTFGVKSVKLYKGWNLIGWPLS